MYHIFCTSTNFEKLNHGHRITSCKCNLYKIKDQKRRTFFFTLRDILSIKFTAVIQAGLIRSVFFKLYGTFHTDPKCLFILLVFVLFIYLDMYYQIIFYADVHFVLMIYKFRFSIFDSVFIVLVFCLCYLGFCFCHSHF